MRRLPGPRTIVLLLAAASVIEGALDVLIVVLAIDLLAIGGSADAEHFVIVAFNRCHVHPTSVSESGLAQHAIRQFTFGQAA